MLRDVCSGDYVTVKIFGEDRRVLVLSVGDNRFDADGNYKEEGFALDEVEMACLNWLVAEVPLDDYQEAILGYCNRCYENIGAAPVTMDKLADEVTIGAIAVNVSEVTQSADGRLVYPEISFLGDCVSDGERGICIGFRDGRFLGIGGQDWTL